MLLLRCTDIPLTLSWCKFDAELRIALGVVIENVMPTFSEVDVVGLLGSIKVLIGWWLRVEIFAPSRLDSEFMMIEVEKYSGWMLEDGCGVAMTFVVSTDFIGEDTTCVMAGVERYGDWVVEDGSGVALEVVVGKADSDDDEADGVGVTVVKTVDSGLDGAVKAQVVW